MRILVLNCGSSSIKFALHDVKRDLVLARGLIEKIGEERQYLHYKTERHSLDKEIRAKTHSDGMKVMVSILLDKEYGVVKDLSEIDAVGHRVVHGGPFFQEPTILTEEVIEKIRECIPLAPLHNPANLVGILEAKKVFDKVPHVAVFDTAFHQTLPEEAFIYAIPYEYYEKCKIRRYGFHGTSHKYVSLRAAELLQRPINELKMITCHLGNGVSLTAISGGKSIDTSMGFTPLEGLVMGTRCGDLDPGVVFYLQRTLGLSVDEVDEILNKRSGLLGISGISNDMRTIIHHAEKNDKRCRLALKIFTYRIKKYIGAYFAILGGLDALIFTAGIGENSPEVRRMICHGLEHLGIEIDDDRNQRIIGGMEGFINKPGAKIAILVIPTKEDKMIAYETYRVISGKGRGI